MFKQIRLAVLGTAFLLIGPLFLFTSCDELPFDLPLSQSEIADGLREALKVSSDTSVNNASKVDGYYGNLDVRILLPAEVQQVQGYVETYVPGGDALLSSLVVKLNRAAEEAAVQATPILIDAITNITITDALSILNGTDSAATVYLKTNTFVSLKTAFKPDIEAALTSVGAQQSWNTLTTQYNSIVPNIPLLNAPPINTDLADYTTGRALDGLFHYVKQEESKIRNNPLHRVTDLLERVFGQND